MYISSGSKENPTSGCAYVFAAAQNGYSPSSNTLIDSTPSLATEDNTPAAFLFNGDGTKLYMIGTQHDKWKVYSLSPAYDISSASYDGSSYDISNTAAIGFVNEARWGDNGNSVYMLDEEDSKIYQSNLTTPYDLSLIHI